MLIIFKYYIWTISCNSNTFQHLFLNYIFVVIQTILVRCCEIQIPKQNQHACACTRVCACACMHVCVVAKRLSVQQTGGCQVAASPITGTELSCRCEQLLILLQCTLKEPRSQAKQQHPTWQHNSNHTPHSLWRKHTHTHVSQQTHVACQVFNRHTDTR